MRRSRRRMLGLTTAVAVHLLAVLALLPIARTSLPDRSRPYDVSQPVTVVQLIRLTPPRPVLVPATPKPPAATQSKSVSLPEAAVTFEASLADPDSPGPSAPSRIDDNEALYRVPFRDAVAHADARLRAGLGCAHVDLQQLPRSVFDLCAAASKLKGGPLG